MGKQKLIKRLRWYYPMEKFHALLTFPICLIYFVSKNPIEKCIFFIYGMILCIFILYQGQKYWHLKLKKLENKPFSQSKNLYFFKKSKQINLYFIYGIPLIGIIQLLITDVMRADLNIIFLSIFVNIFAILEYINYYNRQLMVDNISDFNYIIRNKKFKTASLAKDLKENHF